MHDLDFWQGRFATARDREESIRVVSREAHDLVEKAGRGGSHPRRVDRIVIVSPEYNGALVADDEATRDLARRRKEASEPYDEKTAFASQPPAVMLPLSHQEMRDHCGVYLEESRKHPGTLYINGTALFSHDGSVSGLGDILSFQGKASSGEETHLSQLTIQVFNGKIASANAKVIDDGNVGRLNETKRASAKAGKPYRWTPLPGFDAPLTDLQGRPDSGPGVITVGSSICYDSVSSLIDEDVWKDRSDLRPRPSNMLRQHCLFGRQGDAEILRAYSQEGRGGTHSEKRLNERDRPFLDKLLSRPRAPVAPVDIELQISGTNRPFGDEALSYGSDRYTDQDYFFADLGPRSSGHYRKVGGAPDAPIMKKQEVYEAPSKAGGRLLLAFTSFAKPLT